MSGSSPFSCPHVLLSLRAPIRDDGGPLWLGIVLILVLLCTISSSHYVLHSSTRIIAKSFPRVFSSSSLP